MRYLAYIAAFLILIVVACREPMEEVMIIEEEQMPIILDNYTPSSKVITGSVFGTIVDNQGNLVTNAIVQLGNMQVNSDEFGTFQFESVSMNQRGTFIDIKKEGYFNTGRRFYPSEGSFQELRIELIPTIYDQNFQSNEAATINIDGGSIIEFTANSIVDEQGQLYTGQVDIATTRLAAGTIATLDKMPGSMQGVNLMNEEVTLESFGMIGVELRGSAGQKLNIASGSTAKIKYDIPSSLENSAPTEIALWSFNETFGIWAEESSATLENGYYVGDVTHFSFWHFSNGVFFDLVYLDFKLINNFNSTPIRGAKVVLSTEITYPFTDYHFLSSRIDYSNWIGEVSGFVPKDKEISMDVFSPCGEVIQSLIIGPFTEDTSMDDVVMDDLVMLEIKGEVLNCDGELVEQGFLSIKVDNKNYNYILQENEFSIFIPACFNSTEVQVVGGDLETLEQGEYITLPVGETINVGTITACGEELIGYMKVTWDQTRTRYFEIEQIRPTPDNTTPFITYIFTTAESQQLPGETLLFQVLFGVNDDNYAIVPGDYSDHNMVDIFIDTEHGFYWDGGEFDEFIVEEFNFESEGVVSGYASGNFLNTYNNANTTHFVEMTFIGRLDEW